MSTMRKNSQETIMFGKALKQARRNRRITQAELSNKIMAGLVK